LSCSRTKSDTEKARSAVLGDSVADSDVLQVLFCGDGANDMSALRAATVGVSLCDAETSVAAPVTSRLATPSAVVDVIQYGRCSLITAYVLVLFNIMYGVIQLNMCCKLYVYGLVAGNYMYLIQDMFFTLVLGIVMSLAPTSQSLSHELTRFKNRY
jgi:magnesium-transporting ATPase (P-type)